MKASVFMCGIYGLIQFNSSSVSREETLVRMGNVIEHRGPDDHGHFLAPELASACAASASLTSPVVINPSRTSTNRSGSS